MDPQTESKFGRRDSPEAACVTCNHQIKLKPEMTFEEDRCDLCSELQLYQVKEHFLTISFSFFFQGRVLGAPCSGGISAPSKSIN